MYLKNELNGFAGRAGRDLGDNSIESAVGVLGDAVLAVGEIESILDLVVSDRAVGDILDKDRLEGERYGAGSQTVADVF